MRRAAAHSVLMGLPSCLDPLGKAQTHRHDLLELLFDAPQASRQIRTHESLFS
jgi:hypothetical protein